MALYVYVDVDIHDMDRYRDYMALAGPTVERHGGEYLVRGGDFDVIEGDYRPNRIVLLKFPDRATFDAFYNDPDYVKARAIREPVSDMRLVCVEGA